MGSYKEQQKEKLPKVRSLYYDGLSVGRISKVLSMSRTTVYRWIAKFAEEKGKNMSANKKSTDITGVPTHADGDMVGESGQGKATGQVAVTVISESPEQKIARLERELRDTRLRADFYEEMVNVAERRFDIRIRKKAGTKQ